MKPSKLIALVSLLAFTILLSIYPQEVRSQGLLVNCDGGGTIRGALGSLKPGDTLTVSGTCNESVAIEAEVSRITLNGRGSATIQSPARNQNAIAIRGREITVRGFTISGGNIGIVVQRGGTAVVDGNTIRSNAGDGILVGPGSNAAIINNTIENNRWGITVDENSAARIGWQIPTALGLPNTIRNNTDGGILVLHNSSARIIGATITNNGGDGIRVERASHADITDNSIGGNVGNGITVSGNSGVDLDLGRIQEVARPNRTDAGMSNGGFGIAWSLGSYVSGSLGTLTGAKGAMRADSTSVDDLRPFVSSLSFDPIIVSPGGTFTATFSGVDLSAQTYFDMRFRTPGSNTDQETFNWQQGTSATHAVSGSIQTGVYVVTAVRAHRDIADHSGPYIAVSASLTIRP
ncbi:MAG: right-handed parallel beta-helix repeat-containing protein [Acidobacteriota bacterium]